MPRRRGPGNGGAAPAQRPIDPGGGARAAAQYKISVEARRPGAPTEPTLVKQYMRSLSASGLGVGTLLRVSWFMDKEVGVWFGELAFKKNPAFTYHCKFRCQFKNIRFRVSYLSSTRFWTRIKKDQNDCIFSILAG